MFYIFLQFLSLQIRQIFCILFSYTKLSNFGKTKRPTYAENREKSKGARFVVTQSRLI